MFRWLVEQRGGFGGPVEIVQAALACQLLDDIGLAHVASGHQVRQAYATHVRVRLEVCGKTDFL